MAPFFAIDATAAKKTLFHVDPFLFIPTSTMESALTLGRLGLSGHHLGGAPRGGGQRMILQAAFPFFSRPKNIPQSGWAFGIAGGLSQEKNSDEHYFPPTNFWELSVGRASTLDGGSGSSGLRGYLELSFKQSQIESSTLQESLLRDENQSLHRRQKEFILKMGARVDNKGSGFPRQKLLSWTHQVESKLSFPFQADQRNISFAYWGSRNCFSDFLYCGMAISYAFNTRKNIESDTLSQLEHRLESGPHLYWRIRDRFLLQFVTHWLLSYADGSAYWSSWPVLRSSLVFSF